MRFVSYLVSLTLIGLCSTRAIGQTVDCAVEPGQKDGTAKESAIWKGIFADGMPLTQEKLEELLAANRAWVRTADQKREEEWGKAKVKRQDRETWTRELLASNWEADQGRLVLKGVRLSYANLKGADLSYANLKGADLWNANLERANLSYANLERANLSYANLKGTKLGNANLKGAGLLHANLKGAKLWNANLKRADLWNANLEGTSLGDASLEGAKLRECANLKGADLWNANLKGADLWNANLERANLSYANLERANLSYANLKGTKLGNANLKGTKLWNANLKGALYEPQLGRLPEIVSLRTAENLEIMRFDKFPHALEDLRREFKKVGFKEQERQITYAIKRSEQLNAQARGDLFESFVNYVGFDLPVAYGLRPGRALCILVSLIPVFALFYGVAIWKHCRDHDLYRFWPKERIEKRENAMNLRLLSVFSYSSAPGDPARADVADAVKLEQLLPRGWYHALGYAVYFSVLSAFHIGWRELNVGDWISRLQFRTYTFQATGLVRFVSGLQSLISVYLLAMWALTYFGRPFE